MKKERRQGGRYWGTGLLLLYCVLVGATLPEEVSQTFQKIARDKPELTRVTSIGKSFEGSDLWLVSITEHRGHRAEDRPGIFFLAGLRGNDSESTHLALSFAQNLIQAYPSDEKVRELLSTRTLYILPLLNPDGAISGSPYSQRPFDEDRDGRVDEDPEDKKDNDDDGKTDEDDTGGVDLALNFPAGWKPELLKGHNGPFPVSEPESKALADFLVEHPNIILFINLYGTSNAFLYPYSKRTTGKIEPEDVRIYEEMAKPAVEKWKAKKGTLSDESAPESEKENSLLDWVYQNLGALAVDAGIRDVPSEEILPFLRDISFFTPLLQVTSISTVPVAKNIYRIEAKIQNKGKMATLTKSAEGNPPKQPTNDFWREYDKRGGQYPRRPVAVWLNLPSPASLLAGPQRKLFPALHPEEEQSITWVVEAPSGTIISLQIQSAKGGSFTYPVSVSQSAERKSAGGEKE